MRAMNRPINQPRNRRSRMNLAGAVAVVTGGSRGIGRATAIALAARGAVVVVVGRDESALRDVARETGGGYEVADVADQEHAARVVRRTVAEYGRLDVVVANAGVGFAGDFAAMPERRIDELVDVNVKAPVLLARAALPGMIERGGGSLVFVTSIAGAVLVPGEAVYSMTKAAIEAFVEPLREELRGTGVAVSTVVPGVVATGFFEARGRAYDRRFPRPLPPGRIADAVVVAITTGRRRVVTPRWLVVPATFRALLPVAYRAAARRFG